MALMTPDVADSYSASIWLVTTWNSATDSRAGLACDWPPRRSSLLAPPSSMNMMPVWFWPLMRTPDELGLLDGVNCTPGSRAMKLVKLRLDDGRSRSSSVLTLPPTWAEVRSTSGDSPVTVSDSSSAPICSARSICTVGPTCRTMFSVLSSRKPASRAVRV